jgi:hypothetical protein
MSDLVIWGIMLIPLSGALSIAILIHDEMRARGRKQRMPR